MTPLGGSAPEPGRVPLFEAGLDQEAPDACGGATSVAEPMVLPTDVVWAIDTSGSMLGSFPSIQAALNRFSQQVADAGLDAHIVLLAGQELCVPAPLGSGDCGVGAGGIGGGGPGPVTAVGQAPDSNEAQGFLHLNTPFGMNQGMAVLLDNYGGYKHMLRPNARVHLVMTEDGQAPMSADAVVDHIEGRAAATLTPAWDPALAPGQWVYHGIICGTNGSCGLGGLLGGLTGGAADTHQNLIERSGGIQGDLGRAFAGEDPFGELLDELAQQVIVGARILCEFPIEVPAELTFNRNQVNTAYTDDTGQVETFPRVDDPALCDTGSGWYYDDPAAPTRVILCPAECARIQDTPGSSLEVRFGCDAEVRLE